MNLSIVKMCHIYFFSANLVENKIGFTNQLRVAKLPADYGREGY